MAERLIRRGLPETTARFLAFGYMKVAGGMADRTIDTVRTLTGRPPTRFAALAQTHAGVWRRDG